MTISDLEGIETMSTASVGRTGRPSHPGGRRLTYAQAPLGRLASTGFAFAYMLLAIPALALFIIEATFIPLVDHHRRVPRAARWSSPMVAGSGDAASTAGRARPR